LRKHLLIAGACVWLAGCAAPETVATNTESPSEREYPTGSNLPRKNKSANPQADGIRVHSREDLERIQGMGTGVPQRGSGLSP
jgi:hypothetical protein